MKHTNCKCNTLDLIGKEWIDQYRKRLPVYKCNTCNKFYLITESLVREDIMNSRGYRATSELNADLPEEVWSPIYGFDRFHISNYGNVKSFCSAADGRIIKWRWSKQGYPRVNLRKTGSNKPYTFFVKNLVADAFLENENPELYNEVGYKSSDRNCCHVDNLFYGTHHEVMENAFETGKLKIIPKWAHRNKLKSWIESQDMTKSGPAKSFHQEESKKKNTSH